MILTIILANLHLSTDLLTIGWTAYFLLNLFTTYHLPTENGLFVDYFNSSSVVNHMITNYSGILLLSLFVGLFIETQRRDRVWGVPGGTVLFVSKERGYLLRAWSFLWKLHIEKKIKLAVYLVEIMMYGFLYWVGKIIGLLLFWFDIIRALSSLFEKLFLWWILSTV